jgi:nicotinate-nucleotide pyrophosphorylase (carboxylating)
VNKEIRIQKFLQRVRFEDLSVDYLMRLVEMAKEEDLLGLGLAHPPQTGGDVSSKILHKKESGRATLHAREPLVVCGLPLVPLVLKAYNDQLTFTPTAEDGAELEADDSLGSMEGPAIELLMAERVLLNFLQFLSGVASETRKYVEALEGSPTRLLDTRKTTPGYRMLQKYAVACGGGWNHRLGLFDRVMLKDNHLAADESQSGESLTDLVRRARAENPGLLIEVEVDKLEQIPSVLDARPNKIMLDNFTVPDLQTAVAWIGDRACTEGTGNITLNKLPELGQLGLDFISTGALVHKAVWKDIGLDWS